MHVSGGVSIGRERINSCDLSNDLSFVVRRRGAGTAAPTRPRTDRPSATCIRRSSRTSKGQLAYPLPWGIGGSREFQSLPGAQFDAQLSADQHHRRASLGRNFSSVAPTVDAGAAGHAVSATASTRPTSGSQDDSRSARTTIRPTMSIYNLFNANPTNTTLHDDLRRGVAGADGHPEAAVPGLRRADRLLAEKLVARGSWLVAR